MDPKPLIRAYLSHLEDAAYVRSIFDRAGLSAVSQALNEMASSGDVNDVNDALLFVSDVVNFRMVPEYTAALPRSGLFAVLRANLYAPHHAIRRSTIRTLGKIGPARNARLLRDAFPRYLACDPLLLPDLLAELFWLSRTACEKQWDYVGALVGSPHYPVRWAALDQIERFSPDRHPMQHDHLKAAELCAALAEDHNPFVRAEAEHLLTAFGEAARSLEPRSKERNEWRSRFERTRPYPSLFSVRLGLGNYLAITETPDYDLAMFDAFARFLHIRPLHQGIDLYAHAADFTKFLAADVH
jgi:hypothetical protein